jgi:hypothetical protein
VRSALELALFFLGELEAHVLARVHDRMEHTQRRDAALGFVVQCVVGGAHVGELGVGTHRRHHLGQQHRVAARRVDE